MDETILYLYKCYLGKDLLYRTGMICEFVKEKNGDEFFYKYSTQKDTILEFIKKCKDKGLL